MHGGAWMQGSPETHWDITSRIAAANRQTVISVDYALAPEHPFPAAITQCADVVRHVHANAGALGIDPDRIAVGGDSAGANLAAALCLIFRGSNVPLIGQLLMYPPVDFRMIRPAYTENADAPLLNVRDMPAVNAMYCPNPADLEDPRAAPINAASHAGLPPAFIGVAENDPLRDDGVDYAHVLEKAGVPVVLDRGEGLVHGYLRAMEYCAASRHKLEALSAWLAEQNLKAARGSFSR
jgi:acetyl esterase